MYKYIIKYGTHQNFVLSDKFYTKKQFNEIIKKLISELESEGYNLSAYNDKDAIKFIYNELVNNSDNFMAGTDNNIVCDLSQIISQETKPKENTDIKQVIVVRRDLLNPLEDYVGKMIAQGCHGSSGAILNLMEKEETEAGEVRILRIPKNSSLDLWINGVYKKITVYVDSEEELLKVYKKAIKKGLNAVLVQDAGLTCYQPNTYTCCAIGPAPFKSFNGVTNHLPIIFK